MPLDETRPRQRWSAWWLRGALAIGLILAIGGFYALGLERYASWEYLHSHLEVFQQAVRRRPLIALVIFFGAYTTVTGLSLPVATWLSLLAGALFGRWLGTGVVSFASTCGATFAFLASRYLFRDLVQRHFGDRLNPINRGVEREGPYYLFTLRLIPLVPFFLINLALGLTGMRVALFALVSWVGMLPATFLYVNAGTELGQIESPRQVLSASVLISLALLGLFPLFLRKLVPRIRTLRHPVGIGLVVLLSILAFFALVVWYYSQPEAATRMDAENDSGRCGAVQWWSGGWLLGPGRECVRDFTGGLIALARILGQHSRGDPRHLLGHFRPEHSDGLRLADLMPDAFQGSRPRSERRLAS